MIQKYGQYCPVVRTSEILGDRWTMLIVRDMLFGAHHFSDLERGLPGIPRALLADRLRRLQKYGVVERQESEKPRRTGYYLTPAGMELRGVIESMMEWGARFAFGEPDPEELNPVLLMWWMRTRVCSEHLPENRVVVEFIFKNQLRDTYWLVIQPEDVSVCLTHPGFEIDVLVKTDLSIFYQVWMGRLEFKEAYRKGWIELEALPALRRAFPDWFTWSPAAEKVREVTREMASRA